MNGSEERMAASDNLREYLESIGVAAAHQERAQQLLALYQTFPDVEPTGFFVSEYPQEDGSRIYEALWLFSDRLAMEARFASPGDEQLDFVPLTKAIRHVIIQTKDFDLVTPSDGARMRVEAWFSDTRLGELRASGPNCEALRKVVNSHLLPNVAPLAAL